MSALTKKNLFWLRLALLGALVLAVNAFALPEMRITTKDNKDVGGAACTSPYGCYGMTTTNKTYVAVSEFKLTGAPNGGDNIPNRTGKPDSIKVRGNSTASYDKKPYRIKFGDKLSLFGKEPAKSWVLLANWFDGTFALNAIAFELGQKMDLEFTNSSTMVDLWINNQYKGIYQLTEQVQSHKGRVDLKEKHRGWLLEMDYHDAEADERNQNFKTNQYNINAFIKWPQLDDTSFTKNKNDASQLNFVKTDVNNLLDKMAAGGFPTNGYRDLIDLESFAKYVLIQLFMDNFDFNSKAQTGFLLGSNFCYRIDSSKTTRIKAGPLWDFDLAAGLERMSNGGVFGTGSFPAHYRTYQDSIAPTHAFYRKLWDDPAFKAKYMKLWTKHKEDFRAIAASGGLIDRIKSSVEGSVSGKGNNLWGNNQMQGSATLTTQTFNNEVNNLKSWWNNRLNWVDTRLNSYRIDINQDVIQTAPETPKTSVVGRWDGLGGRGVKLVKNGLTLNPAANASVKVYTLSGAKVRHQSFSAGSHAVSLGDLPRGMYLVRMNVDGSKMAARVPVR
jgi:hypothetical protein